MNDESCQSRRFSFEVNDVSAILHKSHEPASTVCVRALRHRRRETVCRCPTPQTRIDGDLALSQASNSDVR